jgi:CspA family cold shock protein
MGFDSTASVNTSNLAESRTQSDVTPDVAGEVKWFNNQKGYGFIVYGDSPDIFVHHTAINMEGYRTLKQGEEVHFDLVSTDKGLQAVNVRRLS